MDFAFSFKNHVKMVSKIVKYNLHNFKWFFFTYKLLSNQLSSGRCDNSETDGITLY